MAELTTEKVTGSLFERTAGKLWEIRIDGDSKVTLSIFGGSESDLVHTGLESYSVGTTVQKYTSHHLTHKLAGSGWQDWVGIDDSLVVGQPMCGDWNSSTSWSASENAPC